MKVRHTSGESGQSVGRDTHRSATISRLIKKGGLRARIDAKCCECIYDPLSEGTWRKQVENCVSLACPLYEVRPHAGYAS
jgi:hypothetical protein